MIRKSCFLLALLQAVVSDEWGANTPRDVWPRRGLCARIPCRYTYPSHLANEPRTGIWYNSEKMDDRHIAFHSLHHSQVSTRFHGRTRLSGDLKSGDCSLVIDNISQQDEGPYFFRVEFDSKNRYNYLPVTWLHVSEFTDKPSIFPAEMVAGKPVKIRCSFNTICNGTAPTFTWVIPTDVQRSGSSSVTQRGDTLTYTSVLTLTPKLNHHGQTLTCRLRYPSVSSAETVTLTVRYAPRNLSIASPNKVNNSWVNVREGNSAAILCSVQSFPASILTWRHLGVTLNTTSSSNELWLEVPRVTSQLAGVYQCLAENEHGRAERNITLTVELRPPLLDADRGDGFVERLRSARRNSWDLPVAAHLNPTPHSHTDITSAFVLPTSFGTKMYNDYWRFALPLENILQPL
ncbi:sialic acid-binding Ig-like lectin 8 [Pristis pectinata]|uniref:sialic acid-binding Ig-like lectin 8 n=1 Tax=Pristis pectinata TaxID=685728 RepID=UPI00223DE8E4|nr:sialic acid-binding Ig-like lectin 8 [Pristis pectinata]